MAIATFDSMRYEKGTTGVVVAQTGFPKEIRHVRTLPNFGTVPSPDTPFPPALDTVQRRVDAALHIQAIVSPLGVELLAKRIPVV